MCGRVATYNGLTQDAGKTSTKENHMRDNTPLVSVLEPSQPSQINWTIREFIGPTVCNMDGEPCTELDLPVGYQISICGCVFTVQESKDGSLYGESQGMHSPLEYSP